MKHYVVNSHLMHKSTRKTFTIASTEWRVVAGGLCFCVTLADGREILRRGIVLKLLADGR